jgi:biopolymer transport protein ExbB
VPAVLLYNWLVRRNKVITDKLRAFAGDLQTYLITKGK